MSAVNGAETVAAYRERRGDAGSGGPCWPTCSRWPAPGVFRHVSPETGTTAAFAPARARYESAGFVACGPFGSYQASEDNTFMTLDLDAGSGSR